jgi:DNA-binding MarR family transcriptional regulator
MSHPSDPRVLALHGLRIKGFGTAEVLADATGLDAEDVQRQLTALMEAGLVQHREGGAISGFSLTPAGREEHAQLLARELDSSGARPTIERCYRQFLALNDDVLALCTAWQLHTIVDRDAIDRLTELDERAQSICADLAAELERMARYGRRLRHACDQVQAGRRDYFTAPMIASYHTVWFELHEDLLATLGIARAS